MNHEETLFEQALKLQTPAERESYVRESCINDIPMHDRLLGLLRAHDRAGMFLEHQERGSSSKETQPPAETEVRTILIPTSPSEVLGTSIGRYKLLQNIGEGGMGVVYMAEQEQPVRRRVALKIIKLGMDTKSVIARFEAERQALAMMDHPNIAKVFDGGATDSGRPYFVMELVRGIKITEYCDEAELSTRDRLDLFIKVCQAIQHAHQKGIIHRDIKPSNILVTINDGVAVPKVIDFGIAKATEGRLTDKTLFTQFEAFIGTPAYVSPEQAVMTSLDIDTRSDIYSLGVLLYELLAGSTPFDAKELMASGIDAMRKIIREQEPMRPSNRLATLNGDQLTTAAKRRSADTTKLMHQLKGDLDWIVMMCLEKDRSRRYETANGLAMDIQRHLANEPVLARPPSAAYRFQKAWRRNQLVFNAGAAVGASLILALGATTWLFTKELQSYRAARAAEAEQIKLRKVAVAALDGEKHQRIRAEAQELAARQRAYVSDMNVAKHAFDQNNLGRAFDLLDRQRPTPSQKDLRGWEWRYLWHQTRSDALFTLCQEATEINSLAVTPNGKMLAATVVGRGGVSLWDVAQRRELTRLAEAEHDLRAVLSPTGPLLAFAGTTATIDRRSTLHLWNTATREMIAERPMDGGCAGIAISRDGRTLVTAAVGGHITLWHLPDATQLASYSFDQSSTSGTSFTATPDLEMAAYFSAAKQIRIIDLHTGLEHAIDTDYKGDVNALAFSPDGKMLASSGGFDEADIRLWDTEAGREIGCLKGHRSWVSSLVFWPDGKKLASGSADQTIRLWDVDRRLCVDTLHGHRQEVWRLALMPDNQTLVSGCKDGAVCFWDSSAVHSRRARIDFPEPLSAWRFAPDGQSILTFSKRGRVTRLKGPDFQQLETMIEVGTEEKLSRTVCSLSPDGRRLATGSTNGLIQVWDIPRRVVWRQWTNTTGFVAPFEFLGNGSRLLSYSEADNNFHEWNLDTASEMQSWKAPPSLSAGAISPDRRFFMATGYQGETELRNLSEASSTTPGVELRECSYMSFSPDSRLVAASSYLGFTRIWDASTWQEVATLDGFLNGVTTTTFSPDGTRLAVAGSGSDGVRIWDTENWLETFTLAGEGADSSFSPDGNAIGLMTSSGTLQVWRAPSWEEINAVEAKTQAFIRK